MLLTIRHGPPQLQNPNVTQNMVMEIAILDISRRLFTSKFGSGPRKGQRRTKARAHPSTGAPGCYH